MHAYAYGRFHEGREVADPDSELDRVGAGRANFIVARYFYPVNSFLDHPLITPRSHAPAICTSAFASFEASLLHRI